jgi:aminoglycoside 6'-N-acetyltransferase I
MLIRSAAPGDLDGWATLRAALWPEDTIGEHRVELADALASEGDFAAFIAEASDHLIVGFVEASLRHDYVNGCETSPVAFVEGLYVRPEFRKSGVGLALCDAVADWGRRRGCSELASDALADNLESQAFHQAIGFEETERVVYFRKPL